MRHFVPATFVWLSVHHTAHPAALPGAVVVDVAQRAISRDVPSDDGLVPPSIVRQFKRTVSVPSAAPRERGVFFPRGVRF